ncbi:MAG: OmpA family protein [Phocaeicola sp.]
MEDKKKEKCLECQMDTPAHDCTETPKGFICNSCKLKVEKRKPLYKKGGIIAIATLLIVGIFYLMHDGKDKTIGFDGVRNMNDSINLEVQKPETRFKIETAVAKNDPIVVGQTIDNVESFRRVFNNNEKKAELDNNGSIAIPSISIFFNFDSSTLPQETSELLEEYAKVYLQTNKLATIKVDGYACNIGDNNANDWLSKQRAESIKNKLVSVGIPTEKIESSGHGKSKNMDFSYNKISEYRRAIVSIK